jgi:hypothetical protein
MQNSPLAPQVGETPQQSEHLLGWVCEYGVLALILGILGWFSLRFYRIYGQQFFALTADDVHRTLLALNVLKGDWIPSGMWPPLSFWIDALAIKILPNYFRTPALVNSVFATCALLFYYGTVREFGSSRLGAYLSMILIANAPIFFWLRVSALADPIFQAGVFLALWGILRWISTHSWSSFFAASAGLALANGIRVEGWVISGFWGLTVLLYLLRTWRTQRLTAYDLGRYLVGFTMVGFFPVFWMAYQTITYGDPFFYVSGTREYVMTFGVQPLSTRLTVYPKILLFKISPWALLFSVPGLVLGWHKHRKATAWLAGVWLALLAAIEYGAVRYVIASAFRDRQMFFVFMLCTIPLGLLLGHCLSEQRLWARLVGVAIFITILVPLVSAQTPPPDGLSPHIRQVGMCLQRMWDNGSLQPEDRVMIELVLWDYLLTPVLSGHPDNILLDRRVAFEFGPSGSAQFAADNPSAFDMDPNALAQYLQMNDARAVVIRQTSDHGQVSVPMVPVLENDVYVIYLQSDRPNPHCQ